MYQNCKSDIKCNLCKSSRHHTILHIEYKSDSGKFNKSNETTANYSVTVSENTNSVLPKKVLY